ncbi:MAG: hypothetical protein HGA25_00490 [Clostridiales bacterium]|nr:hypothetical protein [Clostridiales bacterium]
MSHQLNPTMDKFYLSMLGYAGLSFDDNVIKNTNDQLGDITIDGKHLTLPYYDNLKNPNGRMIIHPLNESYTNPETTVFNFYKKRLVLELNLKLSYMIVNLITVASDVQIQQRIKSSKLINIISNIGETDMILNENFANVLRASKKVNSEAFLFDIFLKKNGEINDTPFAAIGKINFIMANEITKSLEDKDREYKVFGYKLRKKDLLALTNIFNILFPEFTDKVKYSEGTDNKVFRYLNILMKTSYMIADRLNELCELMEELKEPTLRLVDCYSDMDWVRQLDDLYGMAGEIRLIPNQLDLVAESQHKLSIDETRAAVAETVQPVQRQEFVPMQHQPVPVASPVQQQPVQQQQVLTAEDIVRGNLSNPNVGVMQPGTMMMPGMMPGNMMMPGMMSGNGMMPNMMPQQGVFTPSWVQQEAAIGQQQPNRMMSPGMPNNNIIMTPQGPAYMTPSGPMLINQNNMPMNNGMMPMNNGMMPMNNSMMPMNNGMMSMNNGMMPMNNGMMTSGIEHNPIFSGR